MSIPTVQECVDSAIAAIESNLNQDVPTYDKSFLRVLSVVIGMTTAELYRFGVQRAKQVLALTATGEDLTQLGYEYGIRRKTAEKSVLQCTVDVNPAAAGTILRSDSLFSEDNGFYYFPQADYTSVPPSANLTIYVRAEYPGTAGDLEFGSELNFSTPPENVYNPVYVVAVDQLGVEEETDDELRIRILDEVQSVGGGSNLADYRTWAQRTPNVLRCDPYTGREITTDPPDWTTSIPGERTCFIEATESYDPDGVADTALLDLATDYINYDQDTGERQPCLGSTDDTLYVKSITRDVMWFQIHNINVPDASRLYDCQVAIEETLDTLVRNMRPFILGLDVEAFRNDVMTPSLASRHVQRVVQAFGGTVGTVDIATEYNNWLQSWEMNPGQRLKVQTDPTSSISYVYD